MVSFAEGLQRDAPVETKVRYRILSQTIRAELKAWTESSIPWQLDGDHPRQTARGVELRIQHAFIGAQRGLTNDFQVGPRVESQGCQKPLWAEPIHIHGHHSGLRSKRDSAE
ncbi:hypothetical protein MAFF211271_07020 [Ralstonia syzygii subsp. indonesiensis]|nr:hypothetical protein MAFF211271_07020 [Ralstonia pseudosolanacearum]